MTQGSFFERPLTGARQPRRGVFAIALLATSLLAPPLLAHQTFILPDQFIRNAGEPVELALTSALSFPDREHGPTRDRISFAMVVVDNKAIDEIAYEESETYLSAKFASDRRGIAVAAMSSKPRFGEIKPEDASEYFDEIGADESVRQAFEALPGELPLQRSYSKHAKTFFCIETCGGATDAGSPVGQKLEFVATDSGGNSFRLLLDGEPLVGQSVVLTPLKGEAVKTVTSENGAFNIGESLSGVVMFSAVWITLPDKPGGVYHSDYATLTVDLSNQR